MEKSASENLTQNKFVTLSNTKTRNSYQKTLADGGGTWPPYRRACLSVESKQAPIRGVAMEMLLGSMKVITNS